MWSLIVKNLTLTFWSKFFPGFHTCIEIPSWLPYSIGYFSFDVICGGNPSLGCSKMFDLLFQAGVSVWNHFFWQNIHVWWRWRLNLCDRFLPGCSHFTAGRLFLQSSSLFEEFAHYRNCSFQEIARFRNYSFQVFAHFRFFLKRANCSNQESCCKDDWAQSCYNIKY